MLAILKVGLTQSFVKENFRFAKASLLDQLSCEKTFEFLNKVGRSVLGQGLTGFGTRII